MGDRLFNYLLGGLLTAWFLTLFGFDYVVNSALWTLFGIHGTLATYYFMFAAVAVLAAFVDRRR